MPKIQYYSQRQLHSYTFYMFYDLLWFAKPRQWLRSFVQILTGKRERSTAFKFTNFLQQNPDPSG